VKEYLLALGGYYEPLPYRPVARLSDMMMQNGGLRLSLLTARSLHIRLSARFAPTVQPLLHAEVG
jgi:hypothetical protein